MSALAAGARWPVRVYGLEVDGPRPLFPGPQRGAAPGGRVTVEPADPEVLQDRRRGAAPVGPAGLHNARGFEVLACAGGGGYVVEAPGVAVTWVSPDGASVLYAAGADPRWPLLIVAQTLPLAATLRRLETLHAAVVSLGDRPIALAASQGGGKSSVAAELLAAGATFVADDVAALTADEGDVRVQTGPSLLSLEPAAGGRRPHGLGPVTRLAGKEFHVVPTTAPAAQLAAVYVLERHTGAGGAIEPARAGIGALLQQISFVHSVRTPERLVRQLEVHGAIAREVGVHRVRSGRGWDAERTAAAIAEHAGGR